MCFTHLLQILQTLRTLQTVQTLQTLQALQNIQTFTKPTNLLQIIYKPFTNDLQTFCSKVQNLSFYKPYNLYKSEQIFYKHFARKYSILHFTKLTNSKRFVKFVWFVKVGKTSKDCTVCTVCQVCKMFVKQRMVYLRAKGL